MVSPPGSVFKKHPNLSVYNDLEFPAELPDNYFEPVGIEYGRYSDWKDLQTIPDTLSPLELDTLPPLEGILPETQPAAPPAARAVMPENRAVPVVDYLSTI
jgi:hypothetical protein